MPTLSERRAKLLSGLTPKQQTAILDSARRLKMDSARAGLIAFSSYVDPLARGWYAAPHLQRIASVLERVECGELKRVIIAVPPRHWKSSLASEKFAAWWLGRHPRGSIIVASYALSLAEKFSKSVRETIQSERFRRLAVKADSKSKPSQSCVTQGSGAGCSVGSFDIKIKRDSNSADDWMLETGYRTSFRAVGTGGGISGTGADILILDDVSDPNKIASPTETQATWNWYKNVIRTRLEASGAIVIVNNRVGVNDLTGYLLDAERNDSADPPQDWEYVEIPASNPDGSYLWEARFGKEYYEKLQLDATLWRVQYMQHPTVAEGTEIKREWFEFVPALPDGAREQCRVIDTAWTLKKSEKQDPDYTASIGSCVANGWLYLLDPFKARLELPEVIAWIKARKLASPWVRFGMAKAAGEAISRQFLQREAIPTDELESETVDLRVRLSTFLYWARNGKVKLVGEKAKWEQFLAEATAFPGGKHDDLLATCAGLTQMHSLTVERPTPRVPQRSPWAGIIND